MTDLVRSAGAKDRPLGVGDLVQIPPPDGTWSEFFRFAHTYNGYSHLAQAPERLRQVAWQPVYEAWVSQHGLTSAVGVDLLRGALFYQASADRFAGEADFGSPEEEAFYRAVISELHRRSGAWVPWCGQTPNDLSATDDGSAHDPFERLMRPFAQCLLLKAIGLARTPMTDRQARSYVESMAQDLRKASDVLMPQPRPARVSLAAAAQAAPLGIDLQQVVYRDQPKFDSGRTRFHFEHFWTLGGIVHECRAAASTEEIMQILYEKLQVVWITKEEDKRLRDLGYRTRRPQPDTAYAEAGISLVSG